MKLKSLLYGTAAVLVSTGATNVALAADLPVAAEPIDYVRVCDAFGKGYYYIPGTDTCLRVNGRVRIRAFIRDNDDSDDDTDHYTTYARAYINMDARTQTDLGLLRSYFSFRHTFGDNGVSTSNYDQSYTVGGTRNVLDEAFISLSNDMGQLIVGKTSSFFDFFGGYTYTGNGGYDQTDDANLFAYTFNIGNGVSTTLSLEDPYASFRKNGRGGVTLGGALFPYTDPDGNSYSFGAIYGGQDIPDIVANLRVDQGWGSAQIMGALRRIETKEDVRIVTGTSTMTTMTVTPFLATITNTYVQATATTGFSDDDWGWAVGAGLEVNIPGAPVSLAVQGGYSEGAPSYVSQAPAELVDAILGPGGLELTEVWQVGAGVSIAASSTVKINIDGAYGDVDHAGTVYDYDYWGVAGVIEWKPVSGLAVGAEIQYTEVNPGINLADTEISDDDSWQLTINFQRDF